MLIPKQGVCYHTARRPGSYNVTVPYSREASYYPGPPGSSRRAQRTRARESRARIPAVSSRGRGSAREGCFLPIFCQALITWATANRIWYPACPANSRSAWSRGTAAVGRLGCRMIRERGSATHRRARAEIQRRECTEGGSLPPRAALRLPTSLQDPGGHLRLPALDGPSAGRSCLQTLGAAEVPGL